MDHSRLAMPLGEAIFTQRSIRRFKPDPIPLADIELDDLDRVREPAGRPLRQAHRAAEGCEHHLGAFLLRATRD
jgi:hypothetical protein